MTTIITINNQKGGIGKTTTVHAFGAGLANKGYRTLLIDLDPQSNLSLSCSADTSKLTIYDVMKGECSAADAIQEMNTIDIIPSNILLSGADLEFTTTGREYLLKESLYPILTHYDFILIDTPPSLGILTVNSLTASNKVIIPMTADMFALQGMGQLKNTIEQVRKYCNSNLVVEGILLTKYSTRTILSRDLTETIKQTAENLNTKVFASTIREGVAIREAQTLQKDIFSYSSSSNPGQDYMQLVEEFLKGES